MVSRPAVRIRAYRGGGGSSVYREHFVLGDVFARIRCAAERHDLAVLSSLAQPDAEGLGKGEARKLAAELGRLRERSELPDLDGDLTAFAFVARWSSRASGKAWLTIEER